jgi:hypothetical protein
MQETSHPETLTVIELTADNIPGAPDCVRIDENTLAYSLGIGFQAACWRLRAGIKGFSLLRESGTRISRRRISSALREKANKESGNSRFTENVNLR